MQGSAHCLLHHELLHSPLILLDVEHHHDRFITYEHSIRMFNSLLRLFNRSVRPGRYENRRRSESHFQKLMALWVSTNTICKDGEKGRRT